VIFGMSLALSINKSLHSISLILRRVEMKN